MTYSTNCRSLNHDKLNDLAVHIQERNPDIICLIETWLTESNQHTASINNYNHFWAHRKDRTGGGVFMYVKDNLPSKQLLLLSTPTFSAVWILIRAAANQKTIYCCVYHPPGQPKDKCDDTRNHLLDTTQKLLTKHKSAHIVVTGDFNRLELDEYQSSFNLSQVIDFDTRGDATLDLILTDLPRFCVPSKLAPLVSNDHCCIYVHSQPITAFWTIARRCVTESRKVAIGLDVANYDWLCIKNVDNVNTKLEIYTQAITSIVDKHCPVKRLRVKPQNVAWQTDLTIKIRRAKDNAYNKGHPTWKYLANLLKKLSRNSQGQFYRNALRKLAQDDHKGWWRTINSITPGCPQSISSADRHCVDGSWYTSEKLANKLNEHFFKVGGIPERSDVQLPKSLPPQPVSVGEIKTALRRIKTLQATHPDVYSSWVSQLLATDLCLPITDINTIVMTGSFPDRWRESAIKPLPKIPQPSTFRDYRQISLLHHLSKLAESVFTKHLRCSLHTKLQTNQFAYTEGLGTTDALVEAVDDWTLALDRRETMCVSILLKDFSKAFDRMQHDRLVGKMIDLGWNSTDTAIARSFLFLTNQTQQVIINAQRSEVENSDVGVPQGILSGPIFWLIFADDLQLPIPTVKYADNTMSYDVVTSGNITTMHRTSATVIDVSLGEDRIQSALTVISSRRIMAWA